VCQVVLWQSGSVKERINKAAKLLKLPTGRVEDYHYREVRRIEAHEGFQIKALYEVARQRRYEERRAELQRLTEEYNASRERVIARYGRRMEAVVPGAMLSVSELEGRDLAGLLEDIINGA
jgi:hypothetical protein